MSWQDTRRGPGGAGSSRASRTTAAERTITGAAVRRVAHSDDAKRRIDERPLPTGARSRWAISAMVAGAVLVVGGAGTAAVVATSGDGPRHSAAAPGSAAGTAPTHSATQAPSPTATTPPARSLTSGITFVGPTTLNTRIHAHGRTRVTATCNPGCTVVVSSSQGHGDVVATWVAAALGHAYQGSASHGRFTGTSIRSCAELDGAGAWPHPARWSARLTANEEHLRIRAVLPAFRGDRCTSTRTTVDFTGTASG